MPLNVTPKAGSANSGTPSRVVARSEVKMGTPSPSTARVNALKDRLANKTPAQPVVPRPAGSSARREEMAKLQKFNVQPQQAQIKAPPPRTSARQPDVDLSAIAPPPSGLAANADSATGSPRPEAEVTDQTPSPQFVALAHTEQRIRKAQRELKAAQDAWKQEQANYVPKQRITSETLKVLAEAGITPEKLVELQVTQANPDPNQALLSRIAELETKLNGITDPEKGLLAERDNQAYEQTVKQIRSDVQLLVDSDPKLGTIKSEGYTEDVVELITSCFNTEGIVLDVEEAASLIEKKARERIAKQYKRFNEYEWLKASMGQPAENPEEAAPAKPSQQYRGNTTLTNAGATQRPLSPRDRAVLRVQAAIDAAKGR